MRAAAAATATVEVSTAVAEGAGRATAEAQAASLRRCSPVGNGQAQLRISPEPAFPRLPTQHHHPINCRWQPNWPHKWLGLLAVRSCLAGGCSSRPILSSGCLNRGGRIGPATCTVPSLSGSDRSGLSKPPRLHRKHAPTDWPCGPASRRTHQRQCDPYSLPQTDDGNLTFHVQFYRARAPNEPIGQGDSTDAFASQ